MFCAGAIRFGHYLDCPFYVAFCEVLDDVPDEIYPGAQKTLSRESKKCRKRCGSYGDD